MDAAEPRTAFDHGAAPQNSSWTAGVPSGQGQFHRRTRRNRPPPTTPSLRQVQEQLHAGNSYEVNLTYRLDAASGLDPVAAYLRLRELNPAPYAGFLQHDVDPPTGARAAQLVAGAVRARHQGRGGRPHDRDQADQGHHPARRDAGGGRGAAARAGDRAALRAENLMITDLLRNDLGYRLRGRVVSRCRRCSPSSPTRPCTSWSRRSAVGCVRGGQHGRRAEGAVPGRLDDRGAEAAHDGGDRRTSRRRREVPTPVRSAGSPPTDAPTWGW